MSGATIARYRRVIPGFGITLGMTLLWLSLIVLIPLAALFLKTTELSLDQFVRIVTGPRVVHALQLSFGLSLAAAAVNLVFGSAVVWALVRYEFPGRRVVRRHRRHSIRAADRRRRDRADQSLCGERLARPAARSARHPGRLHAARHFRRAGLRRPAVRGANRAAGTGGPGGRAGGGGRDAWAPRA